MENDLDLEKRDRSMPVLQRRVSLEVKDCRMLVQSRQKRRNKMARAIELHCVAKSKCESNTKNALYRNDGHRLHLEQKVGLSCSTRPREDSESRGERFLTVQNLYLLRKPPTFGVRILRHWDAKRFEQSGPRNKEFAYTTDSPQFGVA